MVVNAVRGAIATALLLACSINPAVAQESPPPLSAYGTLPEMEDATISPDGRHVAVLTTINGDRIIVLMTPDLKAVRIIPVGDVKVRGISWAGNDRVLVQASQTHKLWGFAADRYEFTTTTIVPVDRTKEASIVFGNRRNLESATFGNYGVRNVKGRWYGYFGAIVFKNASGSFVFDHGRPYLYRVDLATNEPERVDTPASAQNFRDWLVGRDGEVAARLDLDEADGEWSIRGADGKVVARGKDVSGRVGLIALSENSDSVIYRTRDADGRSNWFKVPLAGGETVPYLPDVDVERLYVDPLGGSILGYLRGGDKIEPVMFKPPMQAAARKIRQAFSDYDMRVVDFTDGMANAIVRTSGSNDSGTWYLVDVGSFKAKAIGYERNAISPGQVGPISTFAYEAQDGLDLDGILTLPPRLEPKNLPVIMLPHGGPASADYETFDWWAQAFASRGYAVFQPNFRGSTNRGESFQRAGYGEWGGKMQTDVSDGLMALADKGIVDPERACIVGASYGGYAALAGVTLQQDLYRCAVSVAGVTDLEDMYREDYRASGGVAITKSALLEQLGPREGWDEVSPRRHADQADAPILLIHGKDDVVVPYSHTARMADALDDAGKPHDVVTLASEDHWLSRAATRLEMLESAVAFVEKHNPPD